MKRLISAGMVITAILALAACGGKPLAQGTVIQKWYQPPYITTYYTNVSCGKNCSVPVMVNDHHGPKWYIRLKYCDTNGKCKQGNRWIQQADWNKIHLGDQWSQPSK